MSSRPRSAAFTSLFDGKRVLVIDDLADMRSALRTLAGNAGFEQISMAGSAREALEVLGRGHFDVILSDYYLGDSMSGQQLLEYLRQRKMLKRSVIFFMVTAERKYEGVVSAAECEPDGYLLKPFTAEALRARIERLLEKKERFREVDRLQDAGDWAGVIRACEGILKSQDKYFVDALRIKGSALLETREFAAARELYEQAQSMWPMPWACYGLARSLHALGELDQAREMLDRSIAENPMFLAAYDFLGHTLVESGRKDDALALLQKASQISSHSISRQRRIASVAEDIEDYDTVEAVMSGVVKLTRHSPLREARDVVRLSSAVAEKGDTERALALVRDARAAFNTPRDAAALSAAEAIAHGKAGNSERAGAALSAIEGVSQEDWDEDQQMLLARAYAAAGDMERSAEVVRAAVQNNPESALFKERAVALLTHAHGEERARSIVEESATEVIKLNNEGVRRGQTGDLAGALELLCEAAARLPRNVQIVANTAYAILADVFMNGFDAEKLQRAQKHWHNAEAMDPQHPKIADLRNVMQKVRERYGTKVEP